VTQGSAACDPPADGGPGSESSGRAAGAETGEGTGTRPSASRPGLFQRPASPRSRRVAYLVWPLACIALAIGYVAWLGPPVFAFDDAYITIHNAQSILAGADRNFPTSVPIASATSAVHLVLITGLMLVLSPIYACYVAGWIAVVLYGWGILRLAFLHRASEGVAALALTLGVAVGLVPYQLLNGLETGLAMAAGMWVMALLADPAEDRRLRVPVLCGLLPYIRPELIAVSGMVALHRAVILFRRARAEGGLARTWGMELALMAAGAAPWAIWYLAASGAPFPVTVGAKKAYFAEASLPLAEKAERTLYGLYRYLWGTSCLPVAALLWPLSRLGWIPGLFTISFVGVYFWTFSGAFSHYDHRYLYVLTPFLVYGVVTLLAASSRVRRGLALSLAGTSLLLAAYQVPSAMRVVLRGHYNVSRNVAGVAEWCNANLPANATILVHDAGYIAYATDFHLVDLVGLKTPESIPYHRQWTQPSGGARRADAVDAIARRFQPDYLIALHWWDSLFRITEGLEDKGWRLDLLRVPQDENQERDPGFYFVYRLHPPPPEPDG